LLQDNNIAELLSRVLVDAVTVATSQAVPGIEMIVDGEKLVNQLSKPLDRGIDALIRWADKAPQSKYSGSSNVRGY